ncbi:Asp/Glu racemase [Antarctobacter heliothermus]|uniref:Asp/Glu racemase n=1 Tax=Antarctobacter heliothermus TaxID=74033 RepID=A0A222E260_9RHOB|nr:aspartate/glutamate racemase family protein [Antarctobacter heliothermus]ASP20232.1 Asp/Glu racemase [Antarctobacter heliothermus]
MTPLLMNPNANVATTEAMVQIACQILPDITGWTAPKGPQMIVDEAALTAAGQQVAEAQLPRVAGIIVSAFGDPGRAALAARMVCPVIGIGAASARAAGGRCFAVATTTPNLSVPIDALMTPVGGYLGCYLTQDDPLALMAHPARLDAALAGAVARAAEDGAEVIIIGGGPLGEAAERLSASSPVPLISPIRAACAELRDALLSGASGGAVRVPRKEASTTARKTKN